ncbi:MAG: hypothetical protein KF901_22395 [Myxococcales bacterium]|nr:hypothetical protein [Myxococcales bacterium]
MKITTLGFIAVAASTMACATESPESERGDATADGGSTGPGSTDGTEPPCRPASGGGGCSFGPHVGETTVYAIGPAHDAARDESFEATWVGVEPLIEFYEARLPPFATTILLSQDEDARRLGVAADASALEELLEPGERVLVDVSTLRRHGTVTSTFRLRRAEDDALLFAVITSSGSGSPDRVEIEGLGARIEPTRWCGFTESFSHHCPPAGMTAYSAELHVEDTRVVARVGWERALRTPNGEFAFYNFMWSGGGPGGGCDCAIAIQTNIHLGVIRRPAATD